MARRQVKGPRSKKQGFDHNMTPANTNYFPWRLKSSASCKSRIVFVVNTVTHPSHSSMVLN